jgi:hypothetical protein
MDNHSMIFVTIANLVSPLNIPLRRTTDGTIQLLNHDRLINLTCQSESGVIIVIKQIRLTDRRAPVAGKLLFLTDGVLGTGSGTLTHLGMKQRRASCLHTNCRCT